MPAPSGTDTPPLPDPSTAGDHSPPLTSADTDPVLKPPKDRPTARGSPGRLGRFRRLSVAPARRFSPKSPDPAPQTQCSNFAASTGRDDVPPAPGAFSAAPALPKSGVCPIDQFATWTFGQLANATVQMCRDSARHEIHPSSHPFHPADNYPLGPFKAIFAAPIRLPDTTIARTLV